MTQKLKVTVELTLTEQELSDMYESMFDGEVPNDKIDTFTNVFDTLYDEDATELPLMGVYKVVSIEPTPD